MWQQDDQISVYISYPRTETSTKIITAIQALITVLLWRIPYFGVWLISICSYF